MSTPIVEEVRLRVLIGSVSMPTVPTTPAVEEVRVELPNGSISIPIVLHTVLNCDHGAIKKLVKDATDAKLRFRQHLLIAFSALAPIKTLHWAGLGVKDASDFARL
jgi:hypothetical protein